MPDQKLTLEYARPGTTGRRPRRWGWLAIVLLGIVLMAVLASATFAEGSKAMNAFLAICEMGFLIALIGLPFADRFSPRVRKRLRRVAWILLIAAIIAFVIQEKYHPSTTINLPF